MNKLSQSEAPVQIMGIPHTGHLASKRRGTGVVQSVYMGLSDSACSGFFLRQP